jgi:hypothetical protein
MYKFITVARNIMEDTYPVPLYIYQNEENNKYYISRMYPNNSNFGGYSISNSSTFYNIDYPQEISEEDIKKGKTQYWGMIWKFKI